MELLLVQNFRRNGIFIGLLLFLALDSVSGGYETEFIVALADPPDGITIDPVLAVIEIDENLVTGDFRIAQIKYTDDGGGTPRVTFVGNPQPVPNIEVEMDADNYYLVLKDHLDFERTPNFGVSFTPNPGKIVDFRVQDLNDNEPVFQVYPANPIDVTENEVLTERLFQFEANDTDSIDNGKLIFTMLDMDVKDQVDSPFRIEGTTGELFVTCPLDYETRISHRLQISVTDGLHPVMAPMVTNIRVIDVADTPPRWVNIVTRIRIEEGPPANRNWTFYAVDQDANISSPIKYTIDQPPGFAFFKIDEDSGLLEVSTEIDAEADDLESLTFDFNVIATETLDPFEFVSETVSIEILDKNDNPPLILPSDNREDVFEVRMKEHDPENAELPINKTGLLGIWIRDKDVSLSKSEYTAEMVVTNDTKFLLDALSLSPRQGSNETKFSVLIFNRQLIDYEDPDWRGGEVPGEIEFSVRITPKDPDAASEIAVATIKLTIEDTNDESPVWENLEPDGALHFTFDETVGTGYVIGTIQATDADFTPEFGTPSLRYNWFKRIPNNMELDNVTGTITVTSDNSFNFETFPVETFLVEASDMYGVVGGELRTVVALNLHLNDINDESPTIRMASQAKIMENSPQFTLILDNIECTDADEMARLEVTVDVITLSPNQSIDLNTWFQVEDMESPTLGVWLKKIVVGSGIIDRELLDRVDVTVTVTDKNQTILPNSASMFLSIQIEDENDNPPTFNPDYYDPTFEIGVRETPYFDDGEDSESDYDREIFRFQATDKDFNETLTFKLSSPHPRMLEFVELDAVTGILRRKRNEKIDREEYGVANPGDMDFLYYTVQVFDNGDTNNASIDIEIKVGDLNDNYPQFNEDYSVIVYVISEDAVNGTETGTRIQSKDADAGVYGTVQYFFDESYNGAIGLDKFSIDQITGVVTTLGDLDRETTPEYTLQVLAKDNYRQSTIIDSNSNDTRITIKLLDVNDNPPEFVGDLVLPEKEEGGVNPGDVLGEIQVIDKDEAGTRNSEIDYELLGVECSNPNIENPELFFDIENTTNGFNVIGNVNFEFSYGVYNLTVNASDRGDPQLLKTGYITITINDKNDFAPKFEDPTDRRYHILDNTPPGQRLRHYNGAVYPEIMATDEDDSSTPNGKFRFSLVENDFSSYFAITDPEAGIIFVDRDLDLIGRRYDLILKVADLSETPLSNNLNITVFAVPPENKVPEFLSNDFTTNFTENLPPGIVAVLDKAVDPDITEDFNIYGEQICYYIIVREPDTDYFVINDTTNVLSITKSLDREEYDKYELTIHAKNEEMGPCPPAPTSPPDSTTKSNLKVIITVDDVIDTAPNFTVQGLHSGGVKIGADSDTVVYTFNSTDPDLDDETRYYISSRIEPSHGSLDPIAAPQFELRATTGELAVRFQPVQGMQGHFKFTVNATDLGNHTTQADCQIYIVRDLNVVKFTFNDIENFVRPKRDALAEALTRVFTDRCNIDRIAIYSDGSGTDESKTLVDTHFIAESNNEPVDGGIITDKQYDTEVQKRLLDEMALLGLHFHFIAVPSDDTEVRTELDSILLYSLIAGVGVVTVILVVVSVSCWYNSQSLSRRVRALTASTFGSHDSGLNRVGGGAELPNTNLHAIEGSNPIWTTENDGKMPREFDTESVGSGGSVLIGVEDDEDFKNYGGGIGNSNPLFGVNDDGDFSFQKGGVNPLFGMDDEQESDVSGGYGKGGLEVPSAPPNIRRNPLMNMDLSGESDQ